MTNNLLSTNIIKVIYFSWLSRGFKHCPWAHILIGFCHRQYFSLFKHLFDMFCVGMVLNCFLQVHGEYEKWFLSYYFPFEHMFWASLFMPHFFTPLPTFWSIKKKMLKIKYEWKMLQIPSMAGNIYGYGNKANVSDQRSDEGWIINSDWPEDLWDFLFILYLAQLLLLWDQSIIAVCSV